MRQPTRRRTILRYCCTCLWRHSPASGIHGGSRKSHLCKEPPISTTSPSASQPPPPLPDTPNAPPGGVHHLCHFLGHFHSCRPNPRHQSLNLLMRKSGQQETLLHVVTRILREQRTFVPGILPMSFVHGLPIGHAVMKLCGMADMWLGDVQL